MVDIRSDATTPRAGYAICGAARSGSSWFARALASTDLLGRPADAFNTRYQQRLFGPDYPAARLEQIGRVLTEGTTPNGIYGVKIFPVVLQDLGHRIRWTRHLPDLRFIHWRRRDLLGQAISRYRAETTQQWRSTLDAFREAAYDGEAILDALRLSAALDARWEIYFARNGIAPLRLVYEDVMENLQGAIDAVAALMQLDQRPRVDRGRIELDVQRDDVTEAWRARFVADYGDPDRMDEL